MAFNVVVDGLTTPVPPFQIPPVATVTLPVRFTESFAQMDLAIPALALGLAKILTTTGTLTGLQPFRLTPVKVRLTFVGAAAN